MADSTSGSSDECYGDGSWKAAGLIGAAGLCAAVWYGIFQIFH